MLEYIRLSRGMIGLFIAVVLCHTFVMETRVSIACTCAYVCDGLSIYPEAKEIRPTSRRIEAKARANRVTDQMRIIWEGAFLSHHSMAAVNRELAMRMANDSGIRLVLMAGDVFSGDAILQLKRQPQMASFAQAYQSSLLLSDAQKAQEYEKCDVIIRHKWPPEFNEPDRGPGAFPTTWAQTVNQPWVHEVWVPSSYVRRSAVRSGITSTKVHVVPNGINPSRLSPTRDFPMSCESRLDAEGRIDVPTACMTLETKKRFKFLFVGGTIWRKGIDTLLDAYTKEFTGSDDVALIIKDYGSRTFYKSHNHRKAIERLQQLKALHERAKPVSFERQAKGEWAQRNLPEIVYIDKNYGAEEMASLYHQVDCLVHPFRGEGFGLPIVEAMATGLPVIVPKYGPVLDYCSDTRCCFVDSEEVDMNQTAIGDLKLTGSVVVNHVNEKDLQQVMRTVSRDVLSAEFFEDILAPPHGYHPADDEPMSPPEQIGMAASDYVSAHFTWEAAYDAVKARLHAFRTLRRPARSG